MATLWITYAWKDNESQDIDFIDQELRNAGLDVKRDLWDIESGKRLWDQIESFIQDPELSDAWVLYATPNSLTSEPCKEELAYALERALSSRDGDFPMIALSPGEIDPDALPAKLSTRRCVSTLDDNWKERVVSAAEGRAPNIHRPQVPPYHVQLHTVTGGYLIEFRPRTGIWYPFTAGVPAEEKDKMGGSNAIMLPNAPSTPPPNEGGFLQRRQAVGERETSDGRTWFLYTPMGEATPSKSWYLFVSELPTVVTFGDENDGLYRLRGENIEVA